MRPRRSTGAGSAAAMTSRGRTRAPRTSTGSCRRRPSFRSQVAASTHARSMWMLNDAFFRVLMPIGRGDDASGVGRGGDRPFLGCLTASGEKLLLWGFVLEAGGGSDSSGKPNPPRAFPPADGHQD